MSMSPSLIRARVTPTVRRLGRWLGVAVCCSGLFAITAFAPRSQRPPDAARLNAARVALETAPSLGFFPTSGSTFTTGRQSLDVESCDDYALSTSGTWIKLNGTVVTSSFYIPTDGAYTCSSGGVDIIGSVTLASGSNTLSAHICNTQGQCSDASATYTYTSTPVLDHVTATLSTNPVSDDDPDFVTAKAYDTNDDLMTGQTFTYSSSNTSVATIDGSGNITPGAPGSTTITVTDGSKNATASLTVSIGGPDSVSVSLGSGTIASGHYTMATAVVKDSKGYTISSPSVSWSSTNTSVASVSGSGTSATVDGNGAGTATIQATSGGINGTASITVENEAPVVSVSPSSEVTTQSSSFAADIGACSNYGHSYSSFSVTLNGSNVTSQFSATGTSYFACGSGGMDITTGSLSLSTGSNTLSVEVCDNDSNCGTASATYTRYVAAVNSVVVSPHTLSLAAADNGTLTAVARDQYGYVMSGQTFTWQSRNTAIATVGSTGLVTGISPESTYVVASDAGKSDSAHVTVTAGAPASIALTSSGDTLAVDSLDVIHAVVKDGEGNTLSGKHVRWRVSDSTVARLSNAGPSDSTVVTGVRAGTATITAKVDSDSTVTATRAVVVIGPVRSMVLSPESLSVEVGQGTPIQATGKDTNGVTVPWATYAWHMRDTSGTIAKVTPDTGKTVTVVGDGRGTTAVIVTSGADSDSAVVTVTPISVVCKSNCGHNTLTVSTDALNPGSIIARNQCLTIAAGSAGAYECGDLRLAHTFPGVTTFGVTRAPTLVYNSAQSSLRTVIHANVYLDTQDGSPPTALQATVTVVGADSIVLAQDTIAWTSVCASNTCRLNVPIVGDTVSTSGTPGLYHYTLEVKTIGGTSYTASDTGTVIFVDRRTSHFGAGWWLDGLEQLFVPPSDPTAFLWIGGDGSARIYAKSEQSDTVWTAANVDHPDSLIKVDSEYRRILPENGYVAFNLLYRHVRTVNRLGHVARFVYGSGGTLDSIAMPVPSGTSAPMYAFHYDTLAGGNTVLASVDAPVVNGSARSTTVGHTTAGTDTSFTDPDGTTVRSQYGSGSLTWINQLGDPTTYTFDAAGGLAKTAIDIVRTNPSDSLITTDYCPAETAGYNACGSGLLLVDSVHTYVNGPRTDTTTFTAWVNRYGAPDSTMDALGYRTAIRYDTTWIGLAQQVKDPRGHIVQAYYNARANPDSVEDLNPFGNSDSSAVTKYQYATGTDWLTQVTPPAGDWTAFTVDTATGNRLTAEDARGDTTKFTYGTSGHGTGLVTSILAPDHHDSVTTVAYDSLGNLESTTTPLGFESSVDRDVIGRPWVVFTPIDSAGSVYRRDSTVYDVMGRVTGIYHFGPSTSYYDDNQQPGTMVTIPALMRHDSTTYDAMGRVLEVMVPKDSEGPVILTDVKYTYDAAGRQTSENRNHGGVDTMTYDPAGNLLVKTNPRGFTTIFTYDPLNRLQTRIVDSVTYDTTSDLCVFAYNDVNLCANHSFDVPLFGDSVIVIPGDTASFQYDAAGHLTEADNHAAHVTRTWNLNSTLASETQAIRVYTESEDASAPFSRHVYTLMYQYDLDGRRTALIRDSGLLSYADCNAGQWMATLSGCAQTYTYSTTSGLLSQITDPWGNAYGFTYDADDRLVVRTAAGVARDSTWFDADDRMVQRADYSGTVEINGDTFHRNAQGQMIWVSASDGNVPGQSAFQREVSYAYNGFGAVVATQTAPYGGGYPSIERFQTDPLGNVVARSAADVSGDSSSATAVYSMALHRQDQLVGWNGSPGIVGAHILTQLPLDSSSMTYDADGNRVDEWAHHFTWSSGDNSQAYAWDYVSRSYYGADDKLRLFVRRGLESQRESASRQEEYWYDALGRRVLVRSMADSDSAGYHEAIAASTLTRMIWDGSNVLDEYQGMGRMGMSASVLEEDAFGQDSTINGTQHPYGHVAYVVGGLDTPLAFKRAVGPTAHIIIPFYNYRGVADGGYTSTDSVADADILWPGNDRQTYWNLAQSLSGVGWAGSLIASAQDESGLQFKRNRYYDPASGGFTQEDPIGLAGGLNLYGFAAGDPVNGSDPFGLCTFTHSSQSCLQDLADWAAKGGHTFIVNAAAVGSAIDAVVGSALVGGGCGGSGYACGSGPAVGGTAGEAEAGSVVIGNMDVLKSPGAIGANERTLLPQLEGDLGSPKANWARNAGVLRSEMARGAPIRDASVNPLTGALQDNTGFLRAERNLLQDRGWTYDASTHFWNPRK